MMCLSLVLPPLRSESEIELDNGGASTGKVQLDMTIEPENNTNPELRTVNDDSVIEGNESVPTSDALSEYISYYDDPNDDDNNLPTSVKVRTTGVTGLGIEVDGVVTNLDSAVEQSFAIESLDDIFVVGNANPNLYTPNDIILEVRIEICGQFLCQVICQALVQHYTHDFIEGVTYRFDLSHESAKFTGYAEPGNGLGSIYRDF